MTESELLELARKAPAEPDGVPKRRTRWAKFRKAFYELRGKGMSKTRAVEFLADAEKLSEDQRQKLIYAANRWPEVKVQDDVPKI